jgi:hypothetical protein
MDAKINKKRLSSMLTYDWLKIVGVALAVILFWMLILTMTATRMTPAQEFIVYNYACNNSFGDSFYHHYDNMKKNGEFSYEVIEINEFDLSTNPEYVHTMLQGHTSVSMGDVIFVPAINDATTKFTNDKGEEDYLTYAESFLAGYDAFLCPIEGVSNIPRKQGFLQKMEAYLNGYYDGGYENGTLNEEKVKNDFAARVKKNKDKRFKTAEQIAQGKKDDVERIKKYRAALISFNRYLEQGIVKIEALSTDRNNPKDQYVIEGNYAVNLCPSSNANQEYYDKYADKLSSFVSYRIDTEEVKNDKATEDMCAMFFYYADVEDGFQYESLIYINSVITECLK